VGGSVLSGGVVSRWGGGWSAVPGLWGMFLGRGAWVVVGGVEMRRGGRGGGGGIVNLFLGCLSWGLPEGVGGGLTSAVKGGGREVGGGDGR